MDRKPIITTPPCGKRAQWLQPGHRLWTQMAEIWGLPNHLAKQPLLDSPLDKDLHRRWADNVQIELCALLGEKDGWPRGRPPHASTRSSCGCDRVIHRSPMERRSRYGRKCLRPHPQDPLARHPKIPQRRRQCHDWGSCQLVGRIEVDILAPGKGQVDCARPPGSRLRRDRMGLRPPPPQLGW